MHSPSIPLPRSRPTVRRLPALLLSACVLLAACPSLALAQETVVSETNVRTGYAQVLRVEPVFQTLRATRMEQQCDGKAIPPKNPPKGLARIVDAVKGVLTSDSTGQPSATDAEAGTDCRMVPVDREFKRPIAYDVDYVYKGMKYRSRLPYDPGNRLRIEFSLTPYIPPPDDQR